MTQDGAVALDVDADLPMTPGSSMKVQVAQAAHNAMAGGTLDPQQRLVLPADARTRGPVGISLMHDDVEMSLRDLAVLMLTISDNPATDVLIGAVGLDAINGLTARLGLSATRITADLATMLDQMAVEAGFTSYAALERCEPSGPGDPTSDEVRMRLAATAALDPTRGSSTTARESARLLCSIWNDEAGPAQSCAAVRATMARQLTKHRIAAGFPPRVVVAAKSGGLMGVVRNEIGVVRLGDGTAYAVAVLTRSDPAARADPRPIDAAIGEVAALAVDACRR